MKILVLCSQAKGTGAVFRAEYIYKYLKKEGADAEYIYPPFKSMPFMMDFILSMFYYFFAVMNRKPEIVIIQKPYPNTVLPCLMLKAGGARLVVDIDDLDHGYRKGLMSHFIKWLQHRLVKAADLITSHNSALIKRIEKEHPEHKGRIYRLNQCVDMSIFDPRKVSKTAVRRIKRIYKSKKTLFYMANLNIASCLDSILEALSKIHDENVMLLIAGDGPLLGTYKRKASDLGLTGRVVFLGAESRQSAGEYILAADLCLVYYKEEPVNNYRASMKLREYLAMGRPVVATGVGEIKAFRNELYLSKASPGGFAGEIKKRLKTLDKREKKGYKLIRSDFSWEKEIRGFYRFLKAGWAEK